MLREKWPAGYSPLIGLEQHSDIEKEEGQSTYERLMAHDDLKNHRRPLWLYAVSLLRASCSVLALAYSLVGSEITQCCCPHLAKPRIAVKNGEV